MLANSNHLSRNDGAQLPLGNVAACSRRRAKTSNPCNDRNQQYSIVALTNAAGTLVERYTYTAYGTLGIYAANGTVRTTSSYNNRYTYTGREYDPDLKLYHFRARWYDPSTGGFISRDPLGYVDGMSLYRGYFGVNEVDPAGMLLKRQDMYEYYDAQRAYPPSVQTPGTDQAPVSISVSIDADGTSTPAPGGNVTPATPPVGSRGVCCVFSRLRLLPLANRQIINKSWRETVIANTGETDMQACSRRARNHKWWTTPWIVVETIPTHCPPNPFPGDVLHYGHYCGPFRAAACRNGKPYFDGSADYPYPWDDVDLACAHHDCCLPTRVEYLDVQVHRDCNWEFCGSLSTARCDTSPTSAKCDKFRMNALYLACSTLACGFPLP